MAGPRITRVFGAVNIGSFRVSAIVAGINEMGDMVVLGSGHRASQGIKRGYVTDMAAATYAVRDAVERAGSPDAITLDILVGNADALGLTGLATELRDRKTRRALPHKMERVGYVPVRNPDASDGLFKLGDRRQAVYAKRALSPADQIRAARRIPNPWARAA